MDVSNDREIERLGANATAIYAGEFWKKLSTAARLDGRDLDPLWEDKKDNGSNNFDDNGHTNEIGNGNHTLMRTTQLILTDSKELDNRLYAKFRSNFAPGSIPIDVVLSSCGTSSSSSDPSSSSPSSFCDYGTVSQQRERYANLCEACNGIVDDYNLMTLLREHYLDMYWMTQEDCCDGLLVVPRVQFLFVELARCREALYGRKFRRMLQCWELRSEADRLLQALHIGETGADGNEGGVDEATAWDALHQLSTQWPTPYKWALRESQAVDALKCVVKLSSFSSMNAALGKACEDLLQRWRSLVEMGQIVKQNPQHATSLQMAAKSLVASTMTNNTTMNDNANTQPLHAQNKPFTIKAETLAIHPPPTTELAQQQAQRLLDEYGLCYLPQLLTSEQVEQCHQHATEALEELVEQHLKPRGLSISDEYDFFEVRHRPGRRLDNRYKILDGVCGSIGKRHDGLQGMVSALLRGGSNSEEDSSHKQKQDIPGVQLLYCGIVHSFPSMDHATEPPLAQLWHRDGPSLFSASAGEAYHHHPTHCLNVFIPLVDLTLENGPTEFIPQTHHDTTFEKCVSSVVRLAEQDPHAAHPWAVQPIVKAGGAIMFDIRTLHRGLANFSQQDRPMLYFTFARDWWTDAYMFQSPKSIVDHDDNTEKKAHAQMARTLYTTITGEQHHDEELHEKQTYGHPHYTTRFDLLLLEAWNSGDSTESSKATRNAAGVMAFASLSTREKLTRAREFVNVMTSEDTQERKMEVLAQAKAHRRRAAGSEAGRDGEDGAAVDFTSITADMSDVSALYKLAAEELLGNALQNLGMSQCQNGLLVYLATLKAHCQAVEQHSQSEQTKDEEGSITFAMLEEAFTSFWYAGQGGRFNFRGSFAKTPEERSQRCVLVVFSSLGSGIARPEWNSTLQSLFTSKSDGSHEFLVPAKQTLTVDILQVLDPAFSWYQQDPSVTWSGLTYYREQLGKRLRGYRRVMYLGDSMGASACLIMAPKLAHYVLAFTPQVDLSCYDAMTRTDVPASIKQGFQQVVVDSVDESTSCDGDNGSGREATVTIHVGKACEEDMRHLGLLPQHVRERSRLNIVEHDYDDHTLSLHLRDEGKLLETVMDGWMDFVRSFL